jgi:hypothetical protein
MSETEKEALRILIMTISDLRAKDQERYKAQIIFMNETIKTIKAIESQINKHWQTLLDSLKEVSKDINANFDSLLTGINPKGLRDITDSLKKIMDTMNKSIRKMNLESVLSELKALQLDYFKTLEETNKIEPTKTTKRNSEDEIEPQLVRPSDLWGFPKIYCPYCRAEYIKKQEVLFCEKCGAKLTGEIKKK